MLVLMESTFLIYTINIIYQRYAVIRMILKEAI